MHFSEKGNDPGITRQPARVSIVCDGELRNDSLPPMGRVLDVRIRALEGRKLIARGVSPW